MSPLLSGNAGQPGEQQGHHGTEEEREPTPEPGRRAGVRCGRRLDRRGRVPALRHGRGRVQERGVEGGHEASSGTGRPGSAEGPTAWAVAAWSIAT